MINQVTLVGRLTKDPDMRVTTEGAHVAHITLAVSRHYRNHNGEIEADFVQCTLWNKAADNTVQYCRKGSVVGITGRLQTRNYENKEGKRVYVTEVVAESIRFLGPKPNQPATQQVSKPVSQVAAQQGYQQVSQPANQQQTQVSPEPPMRREEVPF